MSRYERDAFEAAEDYMYEGYKKDKIIAKLRAFVEKIARSEELYSRVHPSLYERNEIEEQAQALLTELSDEQAD